ncbi:MAG: cytochrome c oxidase assembly factor Coa1 family protein [Lysobacteraceae bacterium]
MRPMIKWGLLAAGLLLALILGIAGAAWYGLNSLADHETVGMALERVRGDAPLREALGESVEAGILFSGNFKINGSKGSADYSVDISGSRGAGRMYVEAVKRFGVWELRALAVEVDGQRRLLLDQGEEPPP